MSGVIPNNIASVEFIAQSIHNPFYTGTNLVFNMLSLISFLGARYVISDLYNHRPDIFCNPFIKVLILFAILFVNIKHLKLSIIFFFLYIFYIDNFIKDECSKEYLSSDLNKKSL